MSESEERIGLWPRSKEIFSDTFFPLFCLGCDQYGQWLCSDCFGKLPLRLDQRCPLCRRQVTPHGERCFACKDYSGLDGLYAASYYDSPLLSYVIHTYKYRFVSELSVVLGEFLVRALHTTRLPLPDLLMPVPLHPRRLRFRGFNQAELLAAYIGGNLVPDFPLPALLEILIRRRKTKPQMETKDREERENNLSGAFSVPEDKKKEMTGKNVWLIDDVSTTGTTLSECAGALKQAGAKSVFGIVLAR